MSPVEGYCDEVEGYPSSQKAITHRDSPCVCVVRNTAGHHLGGGGHQHIFQRAKTAPRLQQVAQRALRLSFFLGPLPSLFPYFPLLLY